MYNDFLGLFSEPTEKEKKVVNERRRPPKLPIGHKDYDFVRYGLPKGVISFEKHKREREVLLRHLLNCGYATWPASHISTELRQHVALFRARLDFWDEFSTTQVFCKEEIYYRCLHEGPAFAEFIKKARSTCFRAKTAETNTIVDEEYYFEEYDGYNSIIHERYLIHWDDTKDVDDVKYAFIPTRTSRKDEFRELCEQFFDDFRLDELPPISEFDMIGAVKNTKMYDPAAKKTSLMRDFWDAGVDPSGPYYAKRCVVPTHPGQTRDTGIGTPATIMKVKQLNAIARSISDVVPYSANTDGPTANARYKRVLKKNLFLHLDFKKFGLTFPRELPNVFLEVYGRRLGVDVSHLIIDDFYIEIDGEAYHTNRGTVLGWLDAINSLCVSVILHARAKELKFDFVTFNDDVEISKRGKTTELLNLLRGDLIATLDYFDILISISKTFGSKSSVFLERYAYYSQYGVDMYKEQLTVDAYAKSCVTCTPWQAKLFFAAAEQWTKSEYATDRCIDTCPIEFRADEKSMPLWSGGWYIRRKNNLDLALRESDRLGIRLGIELSKFKPPRYSVRVKKTTPKEKIQHVVEKRAWYSVGGSHYTRDHPVEDASEINDEVYDVYDQTQMWADVYSGTNHEFVAAITSHLVKIRGEGPGPPMREA